MKLGNFFESAATCQPINPKPITFKAIARGKVLPGGGVNSSGLPQRATVNAALIFLDADEVLNCRLEARKALAKRADDLSDTDDDGNIVERVQTDDGDFWIEFMYTLLQRAIVEWDSHEGKAGGPLFPSAKLMRELVPVAEADRIQKEWNEYVKDEHPSGVAKKPFRRNEARSPRTLSQGANG